MFSVTYDNFIFLVTSRINDYGFRTYSHKIRIVFRKKGAKTKDSSYKPLCIMSWITKREKLNERFN